MKFVRFHDGICRKKKRVLLEVPMFWKWMLLGCVCIPFDILETAYFAMKYAMLLYCCFIEYFCVFSEWQCYAEHQYFLYLSHSLIIALLFVYTVFCIEIAQDVYYNTKKTSSAFTLQDLPFSNLYWITQYWLSRKF